MNDTLDSRSWNTSLLGREQTANDTSLNTDVVFEVQDHSVLASKTTSDSSNYAYGTGSYRCKTTVFTSGTLILNSFQAR